MPRELDWNTPLGKVSIGAHWRLLLCVVLCSVIATFIWHACFPHTLWFTKLCTGFATGAALGMIPGTWWQLHDVERRPITSGYLVLIGIFGWGFFAGISLVFEAPDLRAQETERSRIRSLSGADISSISVHMEGRRPLKIEDADRIASFVGRAAIPELCSPSH